MTTAHTEQVEAWKADHCVRCSQAEASRKDAVVNAVRAHLRAINDDHDIAEKELQLAIQASFSFPTSARIARCRDVSDSKAWLKIQS